MIIIGLLDDYEIRVEVIYSMILVMSMLFMQRGPDPNGIQVHGCPLRGSGLLAELSRVDWCSWVDRCEWMGPGTAVRQGLVDGRGEAPEI